MLMERRRRAMPRVSRRSGRPTVPVAARAHADLHRLRLPVPVHVGGAERWYRNLAERLAARGPRGHVPDAAPVGARRGAATSPACASSPSGRAWRSTRDGRRRRRCRRSSSGSACSRHLSATAAATTSCTPRRSRTSRCSRPRLRAARARFRLVVDWHEVWTRDTGASTSAGSAGAVGWRCSALCLRVPQRAFCFSRLHERRLRELGLRGELTRLEGQYAGAARAGRAAAGASRSSSSPGRHIPEKRVPALVPALARGARASSRSCAARSTATARSARRCVAAIARARARRTSSTRRASSTPRCVERRARDARSASCSRRAREGYGLVVVEAAARGSRSWSSRARTMRRPSSSRRV